MKKKIIMIVTILCFIIAGGLFTLNHFINKDTEKLKEESKIYEALDITLKNKEVVKTKYYNIDDGSFFIKIPESFLPMDEEIVNLKYPNDNRPNIVYTNEETTMNVAISLSDVSIKDNQIGNYLETLKDTFKEYKDVQTNSFKRDKHTLGEISFTSTATDTDIHNHMLVFSNHGKLVIVTFNCTKELQENYKDLGDFIVNSIMFPIDE